MANTSTALVIDSHAIRRDGDMWCLTDLWRAAAQPQLRPAEWLRTDAAKMFVEFIGDSLNVASAHIEKHAVVRVVRGGKDPATWSHWQIALAYAKALSPAFHARVNDVYRAYLAGTLVPRRDDREEIIRLTLRMSALEGGRASVWDRELKSELARLRRIKWDGVGLEPKGLTFPYGRVWRIVLGDTTYEELKRLNPYPRGVSLHQQWLQDQRYQLAQRDMVRVLDCARRCSRWTEFEDELRSNFRRAPTQLRLVPQPKRVKS